MSAEQPGSLAAALAQLQADLPPIDKAAKADTGTYTYTYAKLSAISREIFPRLAALGLSFITKPTLVDGQFVLAYSLLHTSGQREDGHYPLGTGTPQQLGSAISYGRRYCLCAVTGLAPDDEDDDGAAASTKPRQRATKKRVERATRSEPGQWASDQETGEAITPAQLTKLAILVKELDLDQDRDTYLGQLEEITGERVDSSKQLTKAQAHRVIDIFDARKAALVGEPS